MLSSTAFKKVIVVGCMIVCLYFVCVILHHLFPVITMHLLSPTEAATKNEIKTMSKGKVERKDNVDNSGAINELAEYEAAFNPTKQKPVVEPDPNKPETITTWWQAAAMISWYIKSPLRYNCNNILKTGRNWNICQDEPYTIKSPCLVYSFGVNYDFSFEDAMAKLGCEVHSFDPSMLNVTDHKRGDHITFHKLGVGGVNTDGFVPIINRFVRQRSVWKLRSVKSIMKMLGHENRVIDAFKMDIECYEWGVLDNMIESGVLKHIRQFMLEFHLFSHFPLPEEYVYLYNTATRLREMGFREFIVAPLRKQLKLGSYFNQGESKFVNAFFEKQPDWE